MRRINLETSKDSPPWGPNRRPFTLTKNILVVLVGLSSGVLSPKKMTGVMGVGTKIVPEEWESESVSKGVRSLAGNILHFLVPFDFLVGSAIRTGGRCEFLGDVWL
jgi:hypothetical protein